MANESGKDKVIHLSVNVNGEKVEELEAKIKHVEAKFDEFQQALNELNLFTTTLTIDVLRSGS